MAAAPELMGGLPSVAELREVEGRSECFVQLRDWIRCVNRKEGGPARVGRCLCPEHRHAVLHFLWQESQAGVRSRRAGELLRALREVREFAGGLDVERPWPTDSRPGSGPGPAAREPLSRTDPQQGPPEGSDLPASGELEDPQADGRELFQRLRAWVRVQRRTGRLEAAGAALGAEYRRCVFQFLAAFCFKRTVFRGQAWEMLQRFSEQAAWCEGGAADSKAVVSVLAGDPPAGVEASPGARKASPGAEGAAEEDSAGSTEDTARTSRASSQDDTQCQRTVLPKGLLRVPWVY